jgi:hypothetical protein
MDHSKTLDAVLAPEGAWPICPHCRKELTEIWCKSKESGFSFAKNQLLFCPHCRCLLGFGHVNYVHGG